MRQDEQYWTQDFENENKLKQVMRDKIQQCLLEAQNKLEAILSEQRDEDLKSKTKVIK